MKCSFRWRKATANVSYIHSVIMNNNRNNKINTILIFSPTKFTHTQREAETNREKKHCWFTLAGLDVDNLFPEMEDLLYQK